MVIVTRKVSMVNRIELFTGGNQYFFITGNDKNVFASHTIIHLVINSI